MGRDSSARHFYKEMVFSHERCRVMWLHKHSLPYRSKPEFDEDDLYGTLVLREDFGKHLTLFCDEFPELMKWFIDDLRQMRHDIKWVEREAEKLLPLLDDEYPIWVHIACYDQPADQDWCAPGWLDQWPTELPSTKAILSAARGGRLNADRTAEVIGQFLKLVKTPMEKAQGSALGDLRIRVAHEKETARQARTSVLASEQPNAPITDSALSDREKKIWDVIQGGTKGRMYCRELDGANIPPPRTGVWKDGPRKYVAAYDLGGSWPHRIEDEKSKIRRKATAAKTR